VYVVGLNCQSENVEVEFIGFLLDEVFEAVGNLVCEYRLAVLSGIEDPARYAKLRFA